MSADPLDDASQHEQEMRDDGIAEARRKQAAKVFHPIGLCYNCFAQEQITDMAELMPQSEGA